LCILSSNTNKSSLSKEKSMANQQPQANKAKSFFASITMVIIFVFAWIFFLFVLGNPDNFQEGNTANHPIEEGVGKWLGTVYKGGIIVPFLMSFFLMVITFSIERLLTIGKASGTGSVDEFVRKVKSLLNADNVDGAIAECGKQKGSVGNVIQAVLHKYKDMMGETNMAKDQKVLAIQKELEDSTSLELPMLEKNLTILATLASVSTLVGLLGTVLGMIKAFSALAQAGAPDSSALSTGISEALINTALGIGSSAFAIIFYNLFTSKIDNLTYSIDEVGFSIIQTFGAKSKA
jgi:biopolymer transport protein ExbB